MIDYTPKITACQNELEMLRSSIKDSFINRIFFTHDELTNLDLYSVIILTIRRGNLMAIKYEDAAF